MSSFISLMLTRHITYCWEDLESSSLRWFLPLIISASKLSIRKKGHLKASLGTFDLEKSHFTEATCFDAVAKDPSLLKSIHLSCLLGRNFIKIASLNYMMWMKEQRKELRKHAKKKNPTPRNLLQHL